MQTGGLVWTDDGRSATLEMRDVPVIDQPRWPAHGAETSPGRMSFKMTFEATPEAVLYEDKAKHFRLKGFLATCRMEAQVENLATGYSWRSDPIATCPPAAFAVIGEEVNGKYYDESSP